MSRVPASASGTEVRGERIEVRKPRSLRSSYLSPFTSDLRSLPTPRTGPCSATKVEGRFFCSSRSYQTLNPKPGTSDFSPPSRPLSSSRALDAFLALKSTHPVSRSMLPPLSQRGAQIKSLYRSFFLYQQPTTHNLPRFFQLAKRNCQRAALLVLTRL